MENAGRGILESILKRRKVEGLSIVILSGTGNNGGDGFVAARHLASAGARVHGAPNPAGRPRQNSHPRGPAKLESPRKNETHSGKNSDKKHLRPQKSRKNNREGRRCG
ncbi:MAG: NAD(P)H-hydrate epimerase [Candidatus Freyarchaeota archaeon]